jgi:hypothetical protein
MELTNPTILKGSMYVCWQVPNVNGDGIVRYKRVGRETISDTRCDIFCDHCHGVIEKTKYALLQTQAEYVSRARNNRGILICGKCHEGEDLRDVKIIKKRTGGTTQWNIPCVDYKFGKLYFVFMKVHKYGKFKDPVYKFLMKFRKQLKQEEIRENISTKQVHAHTS